MEKVRVLQGCSIQEGGLWFNQGQVLMVTDPDAHYRTVTDAKGNSKRMPCVELVEDDVPVNIPEGILPKAVEIPAPAPVESPESQEEV